eukprot:15655441-Heterocapsa_arctica.AAC.1
MRLTFRRTAELLSMDTLRVRMLRLKRVYLAKHVQERMLINYIIYIQHTLVREGALTNKKIKGSPTGKKGRQIIRPEHMGHEVQTCGDY